MLASSTVQTSHPSNTARNGPADLLLRLAAPASDTLPRPRVLALFAHPDDEVLAVGARLERLPDSLFLTATDGAPEDGLDARAHGFHSLADYRAARLNELHAALAHAGLPPTTSRPLLLTPENNTSQIPDKQAMRHLAALTRALLRQIEAFRPDAVLTHPFEGGHPDHDSCAFAAHAAAALLGPAAAPPILEAPSYHAGPAGPDGSGGHIQTNAFLPGPTPTICHLTPAEQANKRARLACFTSQQQTLAQFSLAVEQFRLAPAYNFTLPPHPGALLYESFGWGLAAADFTRHALAALAELGLSREGKRLP